MTFQSLPHFKMSQSMPGSSITMYDQYNNLTNYMRVYSILPGAVVFVIVW